MCHGLKTALQSCLLALNLTLGLKFAPCCIVCFILEGECNWTDIIIHSFPVTDELLDVIRITGEHFRLI